MRYPIGIQDFGTLRTSGHHYVDKTEQITRATRSGKYFFLSRPRRFGKSLLISTLAELHSGNAALFEGLWAAEYWDFAAKLRPVVWLEFSKMAYDANGLPFELNATLAKHAEKFGVELPGPDYKTDFAALLERIHEKTGQPVVVLVDEYDKPIIDYLDDHPRAEENRAVMKQFYGVLKPSDPHLEMVFITGVSAFAKVSIFSDLNNLKDITLSPLATDLVGLTEAELDANFGEPLADVDRDLLREYYNGYSWTGGQPRVYNPWSILRFLDEGCRFQNFWYATGTPTFLVKELRRRRYTDLSGRTLNQAELTAFDFTQLDPVVVMFQTGYLTVVEYRERGNRYTLDYPNREVRESFLQGLLKVYLGSPTIPPTGSSQVWDIIEALEAGDVDTVVTALNSIFAVLPYEHWNADHEFLFHAIVHLVFTLVGVEVRSEVHTSGGRCDILVEVDGYVYAIEFKRDRPAAEALAQIEDRGYLRPYAGRKDLKRIAVGISFETEGKRVIEYLVEER